MNDEKISEPWQSGAEDVKSFKKKFIVSLGYFWLGKKLKLGNAVKNGILSFSRRFIYIYLSLSLFYYEGEKERKKERKQNLDKQPPFSLSLSVRLKKIKKIKKEKEKKEKRSGISNPAGLFPLVRK